MKVNPLGTVPLLIDGDARLTESVAICQYLATIDRMSLLAIRPGELGYAEFLNALHQADATFTFPQTLVLRYGELEVMERRQPQVVEDYSRWFVSRLRAVEIILDRDDFLAADRFTVADIAVGYALMLAEVIGLSGHFTPRIAQYWKRLSSREGFARAKHAQSIAYDQMEKAIIDAPSN